MRKTHLNNKKRLRASVIKLYGLFIAALFTVLGVNAQGVESDSLSRKPSPEGSFHVKGYVVNAATNQGFAGVRINVVNEKISAMTESDGAFEISVPYPDVTFEVEAPGFQNQIVALKGRQEIRIFMLRPVGNTSFYDKTEFAANSSSSISDFSQGFLTIDEDIASRMSGQVRAINHSGTPGSGSAVFVKGLNSLNITSQPLYIVDGIVWQVQEGNASIHSGFYNNPLSVIDPNDVEKITVLKGGASIYGAKGAGGVVLIDTKRGTSMATEVSANISFGYRSPLKTIPVMDGAEFRTYVSDIIGGMYDNTTAVEKYKFLDDDKSKSYYNANHNNTDWLDLINKGAMVQNYGISVKGGDEVALYALSMGYSKSEGNIENTDFSRMNVRFNSDINLTKRLKLPFDIAFTQTASNVQNDGVDSIASPFFLSLIKSPLYNQRQFTTSGNISDRLSDVDELRVGNPVALTELGIGRSTQYALNAKVRPSYTFITDKLEVGVLFSYSWNKLDENSFTPDFGTTEQSLYNELGEIYSVSRNRVQDRMDRHTAMVLDGRINWNIMKSSLHDLSAFGGYRYYSNVYKSHYAIGHNTGSDNMTQLSNTTERLRTTSGIDDSWKSMSWYLNADYAFKNRYLINVSAAMDASSRFGDSADDAVKLGGIPWGLFPSVSAGWIISSEEFMKGASAVNFLKLSAGYSISGNDNIPNNATRSYFASIQYFGKAYGITLDNIGNEKLKWETTATARIGLDASFFNNRWSVRGELYSSTTSDLLTRKKLNEEAGLLYYWSNEGELQNKGYEVSTNIRVLNMRDWKIDLGGSVGHYQNEITSLPNGSFITDVYGAQILTEKGQPAGVFYGYKTKGVLASTEAAQIANLYIRNNSGALIPFEAGDMYFDDVVKDNVIDEKDKQIIGDPNPDLYGNFNLNLTWKKFTLGALFTYSYGNDVYNALRAELEGGKNIYNQATSMQNRWVANGQVTDIPRATYGDPMGNSRFSDRWIEDGSYLRFKSVSLSYDLPLQLAFLQGITVWGSVNNIYTFTKYLGSDPEFAYGNQVLYQGIDAGLIPQTRSFNVGVKINL